MDRYQTPFAMLGHSSSPIRRGRHQRVGYTNFVALENVGRNEPSTLPQAGAKDHNSYLERGSSVGRYVVLERLGAGGMGVVYAAYDPELDRKVALKVLKSRDASSSISDASSVSSLRSRLLREAQALAKLSHPNVVTVYDVGTLGTDVFMAMAYIDGQTLRKWLNSQPRTRAEVLIVFAAAGDGLAAAHRANLTHRDFKPENVLIDRDGRVFVLDFGLVHARRSDAEDAPLEQSSASLETPLGNDHERKSFAHDSGHLASDDPTLDEKTGPASIEAAANDTRVATQPTDDADATVISQATVVGTDHPDTGQSSSAAFDPLTEVGSVMGTPAYMAPEQHQGGPTDARTDQFGFCVALFEALYGCRPFQARPGRDLAYAVRHGDIVPIDGKKGVPEWLRKAVMRGLSPRPQDRHASMQDLVALLRRGQGRRRRRLAIAVGTAVVLAAAVPGYILRSVTESEVCRGAAAQVEPIWNAQTRDLVNQAFGALDSPLAARTWELAEPVLDQYARDWVAMHRHTCEATRLYGEQSEQLLDLRMNCLSRRLAAFESLTAAFGTPSVEMVETAIKAVHELPRIDGCADVEALLAQVPLPTAPDTRAAVEALQRQLAQVAALTSTPDFVAQAANLPTWIEQAEALDYIPVLVDAQSLYALALSRQGRFDEATDMGRSAMYGAEGVGAFEVAAQASIGLLWDDAYSLRNFDQANELERHSRALIKAAGSPPSVESELHHALGAIANARGDRERSIRELRYALELDKQVLHPDHPDLATLETNLALAIAIPREQETREALDLLAEVETTLTRLWPDGHSSLALALTFQAIVLDRGGRNLEASGPGLRALAIYKDIGDTESPWSREAKIWVGHNYWRLGERRRALEFYDVVDAAMAEPSPSCEDLAWWGVPPRTELLLELGRNEEASALIHTAYTACAEQLGGDHEELGWLHVALGRVRLAEGNAQSALEAFGRARDSALGRVSGRPWELLEAERALGQGQLVAGQLNEAIATLRNEETRATTVLGEAHTDMSRSWRALAAALAAGGELDEAIELLQKAIERLDERLGSDSLRLVEPLIEIGELHLRRNDEASSDLANARNALARADTLARSDEFAPTILLRLSQLREQAQRAE